MCMRQMLYMTVVGVLAYWFAIRYTHIYTTKGIIFFVFMVVIIFFGTKVKLDAGEKKGKIIIQYSSNDDLERILSLLN